MNVWVALGISFALVLFFLYLTIRGDGKRNAEFDLALKSYPEFQCFYKYVSPFGGTSIAYDAASCQIAFYEKNIVNLVKSESIIDVEILRNNSSVQKTNRGSQAMGAAVGGVLLGPVGILLGGLTGSKRIEDKIEKLSLRIFTNNSFFPMHEVIFFKSPGTDASNSFAINQASELDTWYGRVRSLMIA